MKKTVNANIGGFSFVIDEDAFKVLRRYLNEIDVRLEGSESREVLEDIEIRIADIFNENITSRVQVVNLDLVRRTIAIIGNAEEFGEPHRTMHSTAREEIYEQPETPKKLYRSRTQVVLGGVCGGIADYFDVDISIVRVVTFILIFFGGLSLWVYIVLWIVVPKEPIMLNKKNSTNEYNRRR